MKKSSKSTDEPPSIYSEYFGAVDKYCKEYGPETMVMMQVGTFFEVYGLKGYNGPQGKPGFYSNIDDFCRICDVKMADKKNTYQGFPVLLAGIGEYTLEKFIQLLVSEQKTVVVFVQEDDMTRSKGKKRVFHSVYSPGTFMPLEEAAAPSSVSNHIMAIWIRSFQSLKDGPKYLCSFSCINILSGHSYLYEYSCPKILSPTSFDDLERAVSSFAPNEILFIKETDGEEDDDEAKRILQYVGLRSTGVLIHRFDPRTHEKIQRLDRPVYVRETLAFFFTQIQSITEFHLYEFATQNLCFLLDWVQNHNPNLIKYISVPVFSNSSSRMILANHTLKQLNIIGPGGSGGGGGGGGGRLSSVSHYLNKTGCSLGSRLFQYQIQNPTFDETWLNQEYETTAWIMDAVPNPVLHSIRQNMGSIRDIERIGRQLLLGKVWPSAIYRLHQGIQKYAESLALLPPSPLPHLQQRWTPEHRQENDQFLRFIEDRVQLGVCQDIKSLNTNTPFFQRGVSQELDKIQDQMNQAKNLLQGVCDALNALCSKGSEEVDHVKIHETQKSGCCLHITQTRGAVLKDLLKKGAQQGASLECAGGGIPYKDIRISSGRGEKENVEFPLLIQTCNNLLKWEDQMGKHVENLYREFLRDLQVSWMGFLNERFRQIALLDVAMTKAFVAMENHYCRPELVSREDEDEGDDGGDGREEGSFFEARDLRHVLIEHLQKAELYVANDLSLGQDGQRGILLYGTNAVGKTSLIKSAGIAVIMAQAGMYVPCLQFRYKPYRSIYSRILGNDDLFRGLSTFVVEMSELRVILRMADAQSLVLGDEICSGTETESALSIFTAGIQHLYRRRVGFLFATHFHEIVSYSEIEEMSDQIRLKHLSVQYDRERGELVYNRKLQEGAGNGTYGLEVASSLSMPAEFIEQAFHLRQKYFAASSSDGTTPLSFKPSRYNAEKIRGVCEVCRKRMGDEVHHIQPQQQADERGFIGHHHKNHPANLLNVCFECHDRIHEQKEKQPYVKVKETEPVRVTSFKEYDMR